MNATHRIITTTLSAAIAGILFVPAASACGCATLPQGPFTIQQLRLDPQNPLEAASSASLAHDQRSASNGGSVSIVGMWNIQFLSLGNTAHSPSIPDGAQIDFGYVQWHSDGTEFMNSGGRAPATQNFCLGVWQQTGRYTYVLNHFALSYDATTGLLNGKVNIAESVTLSPGGTKYSGTFTITVYDTNGNQVDSLTGQVTADRITVDTTTP
ncbi:MAG: hypothetical protein ABSH00_16455 [Bryobacteraceae bacterium]|jgi:hypothetical protein